jgi:hypothetical protein
MSRPVQAHGLRMRWLPVTLQGLATLTLCGSDRLGALDMTMADTLDNKNTE